MSLPLPWVRYSWFGTFLTLYTDVLRKLLASRVRALFPPEDAGR